MHWFADTKKKICEYQCSRCKRKIGINEKSLTIALKACARVEAATVGDVWVLLVVTFLRRTPRCAMVARVGALWSIEEIGPGGNRSIGLPLLLTDEGVLSTCKKIQK